MTAATLKRWEVEFEQMEEMGHGDVVPHWKIGIEDSKHH